LPQFTDIVELWDAMHRHLHEHGHTIICADYPAEQLVGWTTYRADVPMDEPEDAVLWTIPLRSLMNGFYNAHSDHPIQKFPPRSAQNRRAMIEWMKANPPWDAPEPPTFWERLLDG
jgi:hypothetical protein